MLVLLDTDTGETIREIDIQEGDSVRLIHQKPQEEDPYMPIPFETFVKLNADEFFPLSDELSPGQLKFLLSLLPYLSYRDNCLKDGKGAPLDTFRLANRIGISQRSVQRYVDELIGLDLLCRAKNSKEFQLYVNPWIACKGNICNKVLANMFRNYHVRSRGGAKWGRLMKRM